MKTAMMLLLCMLFAGCGSLFLQPITTSSFTNYTVGETKSAAVGDEMISWGVQENLGAGNISKYNQDKTTCTILYNGNDGKTIFIAYREWFSRGLTTYAKDAFSNEMKFPSTTKVIVYKGHELQVIAITESSITFKVLK